MPAKRGRTGGLRGRSLASFSIGLPTGVAPASRKVVTRRTKRVVGYFQSMKMQCAFPWESQIERDYLYCLEFDIDVLGFSAQSASLNLLVDGIPRNHFPDFQLRFRSGELALHEVKTDRDAAAPERQPLFEAAKAHCAENGISYRVVTESEVRRQPRLQQCQLLMHLRRRPIALDDALLVASALTDGPATLADLRQRFGGDRADADAVILTMAAQGKISFPLDTPLTETTRFQLLPSP